jgi:hypothetical protein
MSLWVISAVLVALADVRFTPESDRLLRCREMTLCAISDQSAPHKMGLYSITSSAVASNRAGTVGPSALAILRSMTSSYFVGVVCLLSH